MILCENFKGSVHVLHVQNTRNLIQAIHISQPFSMFMYVVFCSRFAWCENGGKLAIQCVNSSAPSMAWGNSTTGRAFSVWENTNVPCVSERGWRCKYLKQFIVVLLAGVMMVQQQLVLLLHTNTQCYIHVQYTPSESDPWTFRESGHVWSTDGEKLRNISRSNQVRLRD